MPWEELTPMDQKKAFIYEWKSGAYRISDLCELFKISKTTAHKYIRRYKEDPKTYFIERSRAPKHVHNKTPKDVEMQIVKCRKTHKRWGAEKILEVLKDKIDIDVAASTAAYILKRNGLVKPRRRIRKIEPVKPIFETSQPNDIWATDFKGKFKMQNGVYCHPLTITDSHTRKIIEIRGLENETFESCKPIYEKAFRRYGLPKQIHSDNGAPFAASQALQRLSRLAAWFIELGIEPVYSDPGHPEQNGKHERMHRELKAEAAKPPALELKSQQRKFDRFIKEYNTIRPHAALNNNKPDQLYIPSERKFPESISEWNYPDHFKIRYVCKNGCLRWGKREWIMVSTALIGKNIGMEEVGEGIWRVYFRQLFLGFLNEKEKCIATKLGKKYRKIR